MTDALGIETRSRSRSKTPGLLSAENGDSDKRNAKKIPTISLIEEEDDVIEVPSSQPSRVKRPRRSAKATASDTSGDVSTDIQKVVSKTTTTTTVTKTTNGSETSSEQATSSTTTIKSTIDGHEATENQSSQNIFNNIFNAIKTSTPILTNKRSQRIKQELASASPSVNIDEHPAFKEYKEAGEYWNKYPKTDYTYSELSPHRRELKNGMVAMPNMSRRSLEKHQARVEIMIHNNPLEESFLRRKFLSTTNSSFQKRSADLQYDSADEVDLSEYRRQLINRRKVTENIVTRFFYMISSYFYASYQSITQGFRNNYRSTKRYTYTPTARQHGFLRKASESVKRFVLLGFSKLYLFVSTILCLDTWILYTRSDNADKNARRKRFLLLLLILLPLLLLGGTLTYLDPPKNISFPKLAFPNLRFPEISFPNVSFPSFSFPQSSFPSIAWPAFLSFSLPRFNLEFSWPEISFEWLKFSRPEWLKLPEISFSLPEISLPSLPSFDFPPVSEYVGNKFMEIKVFFVELYEKIPAVSFGWPDFSLPSLPSFEFSPYFEYVGSKFTDFKDFAVEIFDKIREASFGLLNEAQIVWNENFNAVSNAN